MLTARSVSVARGGAKVLVEVGLSVAAGQRLGIGKSTLLRVLAGIDEPDAGRVERAPARTTVGLLPQEPDARAGEDLRAYLWRRTGGQASSDDLDAWTARLAEDPDVAEEYSDALDRFLALGGADLDARLAQVVAEVGL